MKLYMKMRNRFFIISVLLLVLSLFCFLKLKNETFGCFLLGLFASTVIITIQSNMSAQVEECKLLIDKLKDMRDICIKLDFFCSWSIDFYLMNFTKEFYECKKDLEMLFKLNIELCSVENLKSKTKSEIDKIKQEVLELQLNLYFVLNNFENVSTKIKELYFIELYKILKEFDFKNLSTLINNLGYRLDSKDFFENDFQKIVERKIQNLKAETSLSIYNKSLEKNNAIEYKALKDRFEKYIKK